MQERRPEGELLKSRMLARATPRGFVESKWQKGTTPSSSASSKTGDDLARDAGKSFKIMECNPLARSLQRERAKSVPPSVVRFSNWTFPLGRARLSF
jgi:hypothetical protein